MNIHEFENEIQNALRRETQHLRPVDDVALQKEVEKFEFLHEPYIEKIPFYTQSNGTSLQSLCDAGTIEQETATLFTSYFGCENAGSVNLYEHQVAAINGVGKGRNAIICTGTGSGKTESFLIPIVNAIIKERKNPNYTPGVRALLLYPMNALVNDQLKRIRSLLKGSEVTYGIYTSELKSSDQINIPWETNGDLQYQQRVQQERTYADNLRLTLPRNQDLRDNVMEGEPRTMSITDEDVPKNEYTSRRQWAQGPADILITNYSMLEQLLLSPDKQNIFCNGRPTWKFIVIDEAHSYDGGLGTDIAWLLRRVAHATHADNIQYIATSATLIDDPVMTEEEKRSKIATDFAAQLFSQGADTFDVNLGTLHTGGIARGARADAPRYRELISTQIDEPEFGATDFGSCIIQVSKPSTNRLLDLTQWVANLRKLHDVLKRFKPKKQMHFSDAIYLCRILSVIQPNAEVNIENNQLFSVIGNLCTNKNFPIDVRALVKEVSGIESERDLNEIKTKIYQFAQGQVVNIKCKHVYAIAQVAQLLFEYGEIENETLALQPISWHDETFTYFEEVNNAITQLNQYIIDCEEKITARWFDATGVEREESCKDISACVTAYLQSYPHVSLLSEAFIQAKSDAARLKRSELVRSVFGNDEDEAKQEFDALATLLSLSSHPDLMRKPLMDLRYHQIASGIKEMAVSFHVNENKIEPHYHPNDSRIADGDGNILYTLGICYKCFHPFILVYSSTFDANIPADDVSRYNHPDSDKRFYAFSWKPSPHNPLVGHTHILNIHTGQIRVSSQEANAAAGELALYIECSHNEPEGAANQQNAQVDESSEFIKICPVCNESADNLNSRYGIIAPYASGQEVMRTIVLYHLIKHADSQCSLGESLAEGRKVLAFSDSRASAAQLAIKFDSLVEQRLIDKCVCTALNDVSLEDVGQENLRENLRRSEITGRLLNRMEEDGESEQWLRGRLEREQYQKSLQAAIPGIKKFIEGIGASRMLDKTYRVNDQNQMYDPFAAASLLALSALQSNKRESLITSGRIKVTFLPSRPAEQQKNIIINDFFNGESARYDSFEVKMAERIFLTTSLYCNAYDIEHGAHYAVVNNHAKPIRAEQQGAVDTHAWETGRVYPDIAKSCGIADEQIANLLINYRQYLIAARIMRAPAQQDGGLRLNLDRVRFEVCHGNEYHDDFGKYFRIEEHTAQLRKEYAALNQRLFADGLINILSCSTTFEMGVDLGDLNCVYMNNLPPKVANYKQRAGRAGRRAGSASYVVTLIGENAHDMYYKEHPHDLFFGRMKMPIFYMENETFRAKHFRAIAFADLLGWQPKLPAWRRCESFFGANENMRDQLNNRVNDWLNNRRDAVQHLCEEISGDQQVPYSVADDLAYQLCNNIEVNAEYLDYFRNNSENLSGPRIHNNEASGAVDAKYWNRYTALLNENLFMALHRECKGATLNVLANNRVLPRYGFPCNEIALYPKPGDKNASSIDLTRPKSSGIFEYAPGQTVVANKLCLQSKKPLFVAANQMFYGGEQNRFLYWCNHCRLFFLSEQQANPNCTMCNQHVVANPMRAIEPDAFVADCSQEARTARYIPPPPKYCVYSGGLVPDKQIRVGNVVVAPSNTRSLLFVNNKPFCHPNQGPRSEMLHMVHEAQTDIVVWKPEQVLNEHVQGWTQERIQAAWQSALQAIMSSVCKTLDVSDRDIGGMITICNGQPFIVLYDNSPSGNGVLLPLIPTSDEQYNQHVREKVCAVLSTAIEICSKCPNCKPLSAAEINKIPETVQTVYVDPARYRPRQACYNCIMSYENQRYHAVLDVHDAAVILKALRPGSNDEAPGEDRNTPAGDEAGADNAGVQGNSLPFNREIATTEFQSIENDANLKRELSCRLHRGELFRVRIGGVERNCTLKRVIQNNKALFEELEKPVSYKDIMKI